MVREIITDEIWEILKPLLPKPKGRHGKVLLQKIVVKIGSVAKNSR